MDNTNTFKYDAALLCKASFPAILEAGDRPCIVEVSVYRLNAVAATSYLLDGFEPLLQFLGMDGTDTYITRHEVDDLVTVVHIDKDAFCKAYKTDANELYYYNLRPYLH